MIIYKNFENGKILSDMVWLMDSYRSGDNRMRPLFFECMNGLLEMAATHGFSGNLWHCYLTNLLVNNVNSYSVACEIRGEVEGSVNQLALHDIAIFKEFYDFDFTEMTEVLKAPEFNVVIDYESTADSSRIYSTKIRDRICRLAEQFAATENALEMKAVLTEFYRNMASADSVYIKRSVSCIPTTERESTRFAIFLMYSWMI